MTTTPSTPGTAGPTPSRRAALLVASCAIAPAVILGLVALLGGLLVAAVTFVVVALGVASALWWGSSRRVARAIGGRPADPRAEARLVNLVDGLCAAAGLRQPELRVIDTPSLNAAAAGRGVDRGLVAVTTGALEALTRVELEGLLAEELLLIRRGETGPATVAAAAFGLGARRVQVADAALWADQAAVELTRYPPGLIGALEKLDASDTEVPGASRSTAQLWLADPLGTRAPSAGSGRRPLRERIDALREL